MHLMKILIVFGNVLFTNKNNLTSVKGYGKVKI